MFVTNWKIEKKKDVKIEKIRTKKNEHTTMKHYKGWSIHPKKNLIQLQALNVSFVSYKDMF